MPACRPTSSATATSDAATSRARPACPSWSRRGGRWPGAARWNGQPPQTTTGVARAATTTASVELQRRAPSPSSTTGTVRTAATSSRRRRASASRRVGVGVGRSSARAGRAAAAPRRTRPPRRSPSRSAALTPAGWRTVRLLGRVVDGRASTPSSLLSLRSIRFAQEAQVMPLMSSSTLDARAASSPVARQVAGSCVGASCVAGLLDGRLDAARSSGRLLVTVTAPVSRTTSTSRDAGELARPPR